jgi:LPS-assembly lipoprotein
MRKSSLLSLLLFGLTACGFVPVYAERGLVKDLSQIELVTPDTRTGYLVHQNLAHSLNLSSKGIKPYRLELTLAENRYEIGVGTSGEATRYEISTRVRYRLIDVTSGTTLADQSFTDTITYDTTENAYASVAAQKDGQLRAAESISQRLQNDLAMYFYGRN